MKCRIVVHDAQGPRPIVPGGTEMQVVDIPVDTEIEHPDAWILCLPNNDFSVAWDTDTKRYEFRSTGRILAVPADDECEAKVEAFKLKNKERRI